MSEVKDPLEKMKKLMEEMGDPQNSVKFVHVAGTNGKGSVCAMLNNILMEAGYRTGLYTSPYLQKFNERIRVNGKSISDKDLAESFQKVDEAAKKLDFALTEFERVTAAGFLYFKTMRCDLVVLEVGIGGLNDATNIIETTEAAVITSIGLDHTEKLGDTKEKIALHKAGIAKKGIETVVSDQDAGILSAIGKECLKRGSRMTVTESKKAIITFQSLEGQIFTLPSHGNFEISLLGKNQVENASLAVEAVMALRRRGWRISDAAVREGLKETLWAGRFEIVSKEPFIVLDCGHNKDCMESLKENVKTYFHDKKPVILTGVMKDKDIEDIYDELNKIADSFVAVNIDYERALGAESLKSFLERYKKDTFSCHSLNEGIEKAEEIAKKKDTFVLVTGSVYVCGDIRTIIAGEEEVPVKRN